MGGVDTDDGAHAKTGATRVAESRRGQGANITKRTGNIALSKGKHELTIDYYANDDKGANYLEVTWAGPGFAAQSIPADGLSH